MFKVPVDQIAPPRFVAVLSLNATVLVFKAAPALT